MHVCLYVKYVRCVAVYHACVHRECVVLLSVFKAISCVFMPGMSGCVGMYMVCVWQYVMRVYIVCLSLCLHTHVCSCLVCLAVWEYTHVSDESFCDSAWVSVHGDL